MKRWCNRLSAIVGKIITRARRTQILLPGTAPAKDLLKLLLDNTGRLSRLLSPG